MFCVNRDHVQCIIFVVEYLVLVYFVIWGGGISLS